MFTVENFGFALKIHDCTADVIVGGAAVASLDLRSAVNCLGEDFEPIADIDTEAPTALEPTFENGRQVFRFVAKSNLWEKKTYTLSVDRLRFYYSVTVEGEGKVDGIEYFSGARAGGKGSGFEFSHGFFPCAPAYIGQDYRFIAAIDFTQINNFMSPPMYCYSFETPGVSDRLALGLCAEPGEHNFHLFEYKVDRGFYLTTDQHGHTGVKGQWTAPFIIGYNASGDLDAMNKYSEFHYSAGLAKRRSFANLPRFWYGPIACGWTEQAARGDLPGGQQGRATETVYRDFADRLNEKNLHPQIMIIDDKWQKDYGTNAADPDKWQDMRRFTDDMHGRGIHTFLWFRAFADEGLTEGIIESDLSSTIVDPPGLRCDPSHPAYLKMLDESLYRMLSSDEGCYNCDGLKLDFLLKNPMGRKFKTYSGKYGNQLMHDYIEHIYKTAKEIKPEAVINCSACHPYFADIQDQARLYDYYELRHTCREDMTARAAMYRAAMPGCLVDADTPGYGTKRDTLRAIFEQAEYGIPDCYAITGIGGEDVYEALAQIWKEYGEIIDGMYQ